MPRKATLSVMGMYNYYDSLFDGFRIPANMEIEDQDVKQDIIDTICIESSGLEVLYPEPEVFKFAIEKWTNLNFKIWDELQATRLYEYNPIWNKDGTVTETETRDLSGSKTGTSLKNLQAATSGSESTTGGGTRDQTLDSETDTQTEGTADKTTTNSVKVFNQANADAWSDSDKSVEDGDTTGTENTVNHSESSETWSETGSRTSSEQHGETITGSDTERSTDTGTITHERVEKGNIGVTTTQQMIKEQREVVTFATERYIIDSFIERFCLLIY